MAEDRNVNIKFPWLGIVQVALVALRVTGYIDWPWYVVFAPTILVTVALAFIAIILLVAAWLDGR